MSALERGKYPSDELQKLSASERALSNNVREQGAMVKRMDTTLRNVEKESLLHLADKGATNAPAPGNGRTGLFK